MSTEQPDEKPTSAEDMPNLEAEEHDGPSDMIMPLGHCTVLRGLDSDGDPALWYDVEPGLDIVTALGMVEMLRQRILAAAQPFQQEDDD